MLLDLFNLIPAGLFGQIFSPFNMKLFNELLLSVVLGAVIGIERRLARKEAGMRTFAFVSMGSTLFSIISVYALKYISETNVAAFSPAQIAAGIVTGVGFIGAGLVIFSESRLHGVTTAAGLWLAAAIGMAIGFEFYALAVFATIIAILILGVFWVFEERIVRRLAPLETGLKRGAGIRKRGSIE